VLDLLAWSLPASASADASKEITLNMSFGGAKLHSVPSYDLVREVQNAYELQGPCEVVVSSISVTSMRYVLQKNTIAALGGEVNLAEIVKAVSGNSPMTLRLERRNEETLELIQEFPEPRFVFYAAEPVPYVKPEPGEAPALKVERLEITTQETVPRRKGMLRDDDAPVWTNYLRVEFNRPVSKVTGFPMIASGTRKVQWDRDKPGFKVDASDSRIATGFNWLISPHYKDEDQIQNYRGMRTYELTVEYPDGDKTAIQKIVVEAKLLGG